MGGAWENLEIAVLHWAQGQGAAEGHAVNSSLTVKQMDRKKIFIPASTYK